MSGRGLYNEEIQRVRTKMSIHRSEMKQTKELEVVKNKSNTIVYFERINGRGNKIQS